MLVTLLTLALAADPTPLPLWPGEAPHSVGDPAANRPTLTAYLPPEGKGNGTAVVVCPGGGYGFLADKHEGTDVCRWLNDRGVAAFLLRYRIVVKDKRPAPLHPAPLEDAQRAIRTVRASAKAWKLDPNRIGIWGFSAGGHLASSVATHFDAGKPGGDSIDAVSCRPDFAILAYPVVSMDPQVSHGGSRANLLGNKPDPKLIELMSNEKQVTKETPPCFLFHTAEDKAVPIRNAHLFVEACKRHGVPVELAEYEKGKHGVGLAPEDPVLKEWPERLAAWMKGRGLIK